MKIEVPTDKALQSLDDLFISSVGYYNLLITDYMSKNVGGRYDSLITARKEKQAAVNDLIEAIVSINFPCGRDSSVWNT